MSPVVIADSDDDDDSSYSPPLSRPTRSPHAVDTSGSTDSAFFRSVLDEQSEAARNCAKGPKGGREIESFDARGMMSTDPLQEHTEDDARGQKADDPWEIPSSPVGRPSSTTKRSAKKGPKKTPKRTPKKPTAPISAETTSPGYGEEERRSSKRRKIEPDPIPTQDSDSVDLVQLPSTQEADADADAQATSTMPPPTFTIERTPRIVGNALTDSQKKEYQSFAATGGTELSQDQGPMRDAAPVARSSSSATNANTPRSDPISSRNMHIIHEQETPVKEATKRSAGNWGSSPDEISAIQPTPTTPRARKRKTQPNEQTKHELEPDTSNEHQDLHAYYNDDDEGSDFTEEPVVQEPKRRRGRPKKTPEYGADKSNETPGVGVHYDDKNEESGFVEEPVAQKPKKQRGRPKKPSAAAGAAEAGEPASPTTSHAAQGRSATKGKRKRGRPRKAEQLAVEGLGEEAEDDTRVDTKGAKTGESGHAPEEDATHEPKQEARDDAEASLSRNEEVPESHKSSKVEKESVASDRKAPEDAGEVGQAGQETSKPKPRPTVSSASLSASKPLHRVGLSKRSRIAPLLKIRK